MKEQVHINMWLESENGITLGVGRVQLLLLVHELGSLSKAAEKLGMSYRAAWGKIKRAEKALGIELIEATGSRRDGSQLTQEGLQLVHSFLNIYNKVLKFAEEEFQKGFNCDNEK